MIGIVDVEVQSHNPSMPLYPLRAFVNSPSSVRVRNVPKKIGNWLINKVYFNAAYPDGSIKSADCVLVGGVWVGTIEGSSTSGSSLNGYTIFADGKDENGNDVSGYILGKGDIQILEADGTITPGETTYYVHMLSGAPEQPKEGDLWPLSSGGYVIWQNGQANSLGLTEDDLSAYATKTITQTNTTITILPDSFSAHPYGGSVSHYRTIGSTIIWYDVDGELPWEVNYDVNTHQLSYIEDQRYVVGIYTPEQLVQMGVNGQSIHFYDEDTGFEFEIEPSPNSTEYTTTQQITKEVVYAEGGYDAIEKMLGDIETILNSL